MLITYSLPDWLQTLETFHISQQDLIANLNKYKIYESY